LPNARRIEFEGLDHSAPWNTDLGGDPEPIAQALVAFFIAESKAASLGGI
jgi:hypothetical protein